MDENGAEKRRILLSSNSMERFCSRGKFDINDISFQMEDNASAIYNQYSQLNVNQQILTTTQLQHPFSIHNQENVLTHLQNSSNPNNNNNNNNTTILLNHTPSSHHYLHDSSFAVSLHDDDCHNEHENYSYYNNTSQLSHQKQLNFQQLHPRNTYSPIITSTSQLESNTVIKIHSIDRANQHSSLPLADTANARFTLNNNNNNCSMDTNSPLGGKSSQHKNNADIIYVTNENHNTNSKYESNSFEQREQKPLFIITQHLNEIRPKSTGATSPPIVNQSNNSIYKLESIDPYKRVIKQTELHAKNPRNATNTPKHHAIVLPAIPSIQSRIAAAENKQLAKKQNASGSTNSNSSSRQNAEEQNNQANVKKNNGAVKGGTDGMSKKATSKKRTNSLAVFNRTNLVKKFISSMLQRTQSYLFKNLTLHQLRLIGDESANFDVFLAKTSISTNSTKSFCKEVLDRISSVFFSAFTSQRLILLPESWVSLCWEICSIIIFTYLIFVIPYQVNFKHTEVLQTQSNMIQHLPICMLVLDILMKLNKAIYKRGMIIVSREQILKNFLKKHALLDFAVLIIYSISQIFKEDFYYLEYIIILRIVPVIRTIKEMFETHDQEGKYGILVKITVLVLLILSFGNIQGSIFVHIALQNPDRSNTWLAQIGQSYSSQCSTQQTSNPSSTSQSDLSQLSHSEIYVAGLYWATITMSTIGYGDIHPTNVTEMIYASVVSLISCGIFGYSISQIGEIVTEIQEKKESFNKKMRILNKLMKQGQVSKKLQHQVRNYHEYLHKEDCEDEEMALEIINTLPTSMKEAINYDMNHRLLCEKRLFSLNFSPSFLSLLSLRMKRLKVGPEVAIFSQNDLATRLYFLVKGSVELGVSMGNGNRVKPCKVFKKGDIIGESEFLTQSYHGFTGRTLNVVKLMYITFDDFNRCLHQFPFDFEKYHELKDKIGLFHDLTKVDKRCESCDKFTHQLLDCPYVRFSPDPQRVLSQSSLNISETQERKTCLEMIAEDVEKQQLFINQPKGNKNKHHHHHHHHQHQNQQQNQNKQNQESQVYRSRIKLKAIKVQHKNSIVLEFFQQVNQIEIQQFTFESRLQMIEYGYGVSGNPTSDQYYEHLAAAAAGAAYEPDFVKDDTQYDEEEEYDEYNENSLDQHDDEHNAYEKNKNTSMKKQKRKKSDHMVRNKSKKAMTQVETKKRQKNLEGLQIKKANPIVRDPLFGLNKSISIDEQLSNNFEEQYQQQQQIQKRGIPSEMNQQFVGMQVSQGTNIYNLQQQFQKEQFPQQVVQQYSIPIGTSCLLPQSNQLISLTKIRNAPIGVTAAAIVAATGIKNGVINGNGNGNSLGFIQLDPLRPIVDISGELIAAAAAATAGSSRQLAMGMAAGVPTSDNAIVGGVKSQGNISLKYATGGMQSAFLDQLEGKMRVYQYYFPHNNFDLVLARFRKKQLLREKKKKLNSATSAGKKSKRKLLQLQFEQNCQQANIGQNNNNTKTLRNSRHYYNQCRSMIHQEFSR